MDRSDDGGMAPPLQACNHQPTSLETKEDKTKEVTLHEKVRGSTCEDSMCKDTAIETETSEPTANAAGDAESSSNLESSSSPCTLSSGLKDTLPPVSMPAIHIGQGDSTVADVTNLNGWNHCDKSHTTGVLLETNDVSNIETPDVLIKEAKVVKKPDVHNFLIQKRNVKQPNGTVAPLNGGLLTSTTSLAQLETCSGQGMDVGAAVGAKAGKMYADQSEHKADNNRFTKTPNGNDGVSPVPGSPVCRQDENSDRECSRSSVLEGIEQPPALEIEERTDSLALGRTEQMKSAVLEFGERIRLQSDQQSESSQSQPSKSHKRMELARSGQEAHLFISGAGSLIQIRQSRSPVSENEPSLPLSFAELRGCATPHGKNEDSDSPVPVIDESSGDQHTFNYTDLLTGDLSKMNMSDKLTSQESTVLPRVSPISLENDTPFNGPPDTETCDTVNTGQDLAIQGSTKSLDSSMNEDLAGISCEERTKSRQEAKIEAKTSSAVDGLTRLDGHLNLLQKKIIMLRCCAVKRHTKKEITNVVSQVPDMTQTNWPCSDIVDSDVASNVHSSDFWQWLFKYGMTSSTKQLSYSESNIKSQKRTDPINTTENSKSSLTISVKKEPATSSLKPSGNLTRTDTLSSIQPARVDYFSSSGYLQKTLQRARFTTGVLKKELHYVMSCCDPDLTDSSSDEETTEAATLVVSTQKQRSVSKSACKLGATRFRKSFCKWVAERAEISRKWSWLQSQISGMEFTVCQQGELYAQLRNSKGVVQLDVKDQRLSFSSQSAGGQSVTSEQNIPDSSEACVAVSASPCNVNSLINNIHHQTSRLFDKLSPVSGGSPSPNLPPGDMSRSRSLNSELMTASSDATVVDSMVIADSCARTRQLHRSTFRNRTLVKISPASLASTKPLKPATVPNDSFIMSCTKGDSVAQNEEQDCTSLASKAASHDHSYYKVVSSVADIPLSFSMRAVMKSKRKWCKKSLSRKHNDKLSKKQRRKKKAKHKAQKKNKRSYTAMVSSHLDYAGESKVRKVMSQVLDSGRRTHKGSFDSEMDSSVMTGFNYLQLSGNGTPTSEITSHAQTHSKKKKAAEQAYDINNIIIPHGLASARIEKLAYKEIQTPSWKVLESCRIKEEADTEGPSEDDLTGTDVESEDTSDKAFQRRHDRHEIIEKNKYIAFMEWSVSRKGGRGSRMGNIRGPRTPEPASPSVLWDMPSPVSFVGEPFSITSSSGIPTRQVSCDPNFGRPSTPPPQHNQHIIDTPLSHSLSSPNGASWSDGLGPAREPSGIAATVHRTSSDSLDGHSREQHKIVTWEVRSFPLEGEDVRLLSDIEFAKAKLCTDEGTRRHSTWRQAFADKAHADHARNSFHESCQQAKFGAVKRRRTDSRASSLASHDDTARHSDASNASASSVRRKFRKTQPVKNHASLSRRGKGGKGSFRTSEAARNSKDKIVHVRLSETDDSMSGSGSDSDSSDEISSSYDDAGHIVDDYADPEWEVPAQRHRDKRGGK